jgi:predicted kinase
VISGVSAAGKSTVARLLAERFQHGVCVPGDAIRAMMVSGRVDMRPGAGAEALRQLALRYSGALAVADVFLGAGFDVVVEDVIIGPILRDFLGLVPMPEFHLVFLDPDAAAIEQRERERDRIAYRPGPVVGRRAAGCAEGGNRPDRSVARHDLAQCGADSRGHPVRPGRQPRPTAPASLTSHRTNRVKIRGPPGSMADVAHQPMEICRTSVVRSQAMQAWGRAQCPGSGPAR